MAKILSHERETEISYDGLRGALRRFNDDNGTTLEQLRAERGVSVPIRNRYTTNEPVEEDEEYFTPVLLPEPKTPRVIEPVRLSVHNARLHKPDRIRIGAIGDTHNGSNYEDLEALHTIYDIFAAEGVSSVYLTGNYIDGEARFNENDLKVRGMDNQIRYFCANFPRRDGISTYFIAGDDHEGWYVQKYGVEIGEHTEDIARRQGRDDLHYLGYMEADVPIELPTGERLTMRVLHAGGGSSYALSHTSQKIVDSYDDYERPFLLLVGHFHKAEYLPNYRGVKIVQTGTFQRQTPFMRKKRLHADVGGWIVDISIVDDTTTRVSAEFIHFTQRPWKHVMGGDLS